MPMVLSKADIPAENPVFSIGMRRVCKKSPSVKKKTIKKGMNTKNTGILVAGLRTLNIGT